MSSNLFRPRLLWPLRYTLGIYLRSYLCRCVDHRLTLG